MRGCESPLDQVRVAAPCNVGWENMVGDERVRFCGQCSLNVYNLSGMTRREAERLVVQSEGRLCIRYYRRADGTILTKNCPVGLRALRKRVARVATACASAALSFFAGILAAAGLSERPAAPAVTKSEVIEIQVAPSKPAAFLGQREIVGRPVRPVGQYVKGQMQSLSPKLGRFKRH